MALQFSRDEYQYLHRCRPVTNSSLTHQSGSTNSILAKGPTLLGNMKTIFTQFRLKKWTAVLDLSRAYRSVKSTKKSNRMRLHLYPKDVNDPNSPLLVLIFTCMTYGDQVAAAALEVIMRELLAPKCKTKLGAKILTDHRFVDDITLSHHSKEELIEGLQDVAKVLGEHGFDIKIISTNFTLPADLQPKENEEDLESVFHHIWDKKEDMLFNIPRLNIHPKKRGMYIGPDLVSTPNTTLTTVPITKTLVARLLGQLYSLTGAFFAPVTACFKSFFNEACDLSKTWKVQELYAKNERYYKRAKRLQETISPRELFSILS